MSPLYNLEINPCGLEPLSNAFGFPVIEINRWPDHDRRHLLTLWMESPRDPWAWKLDYGWSAKKLDKVDDLYCSTMSRVFDLIERLQLGSLEVWTRDEGSYEECRASLPGNPSDRDVWSEMYHTRDCLGLVIAQNRSEVARGLRELFKTFELSDRSDIATLLADTAEEIRRGALLAVPAGK